MIAQRGDLSEIKLTSGRLCRELQAVGFHMQRLDALRFALAGGIYSAG
jgi:hypothetical protein